MRKFTLSTISIIFTLFMSAASAVEWKQVSSNHHATYYVNIDSIKNKGKYVYYWDLGNLFGPISDGILSIKSYNQGNCEKFLRKSLKNSFHKKPMGDGIGVVSNSNRQSWKTPPPASSSAKILEFVCNYSD